VRCKSSCVRASCSCRCWIVASLVASSSPSRWARVMHRVSAACSRTILLEDATRAVSCKPHRE
jgi:hypothetical protein